MPVKEIELIRYKSLSDIPTASNLRRYQSEASLLECGNDTINSGFSMLKLSKTRITVGDSITVYWDIRETCGANDWIGLFDLDGPTSLSNYLDCKQRGVTGARRGAIKWVVSRSINLSEVETKCIFKYVCANTGSVRAISPTLFIQNPFAEIPGSGGRRQSCISQETLLEFSVSGLRAQGLKKNIFGKPSPYVKLSIVPSRRHFRSWKHHHGQIAKTSSQHSTINPEWDSEEFVFLGGHDDVLEIETRNKFSGTRPAFSRFLGKLCIPLSDVFECQNVRPGSVTKPLGKRTPADRIQGTVTFTISIVTSINDPARQQGATASSQQENISPHAVVTSQNPQRGVTSTCVVLTNPALRSSAPNLLQPLDLNLSSAMSGDYTDTPSPLSPFVALERNTTSQDVVSRRRIFSRDSRPFSELYSGDFVPLDDGPTVPGRELRSDTVSSVQSETTPDHPLEIVEERGTTVVMTHDNEQVLQEERDRLTPDSTTNIEIEEVSTHPDVGNETPVIEPNDDGCDDTIGSSYVPLQQMELLSDHEGDGESDVAITENEPCEQANTSYGIRANAGSIELTQDSPLRLIEEIAYQEALFQPRDNDFDYEDDDNDEDEQMDTTEVLSDDTDDLISEVPPAMDEDTSSISPSLISVDSWSITLDSTSVTPSITSIDPLPITNCSAYDRDRSSEQRVSEEGSISISTTRVHGPTNSRNGENVESTLSPLEESVTISFPLADAHCIQGPSVAATLMESASQDVIDQPIPAIYPIAEIRILPSPASTIATTRRLSLLETVNQIVGHDSISEEASTSADVYNSPSSQRSSERTPPKPSTVDGIEILSAEVITSEVSFSNSRSTPTSPTVRHEGSSPREEVSSLVFPMDGSEPVCLDMTSVQGSSGTEMLVDPPHESSNVATTTPQRLNSRTVSVRSNQSLRSDMSDRSEAVEDRRQPSRPTRRSKHLVRSNSDPRGSFPSDRPERIRRRRTETEPRLQVERQVSASQHAQSLRSGVSAVVAFSEEGPLPAPMDFARRVVIPQPAISTSGVTGSIVTPTAGMTQRDSLSDSVVIAVPMMSPTADSPIMARNAGEESSLDSVVIANALPSSSSSVTPLHSPSLDSDAGRSESISSESETVVAVPVAVTSAESTSYAPVSSEERTVVEAFPLSPVNTRYTTTSVTPIPSPTSSQHDEITTSAETLLSQTSDQPRERTSRPSAPPPASVHQIEQAPIATQGAERDNSVTQFRASGDNSSVYYATAIPGPSIRTNTAGDDSRAVSSPISTSPSREAPIATQGAERDNSVTQFRASSHDRSGDNSSVYYATAIPGPSMRTNAAGDDSGAVSSPISTSPSRECISEMLRGYVISAKLPQRPPQHHEPRLRRDVTDNGQMRTERKGSRPSRHDPTVETPPRRRSSRQQRQQAERQQQQQQNQQPQPVHLQIQDQQRHQGTEEEEETLPPNWERGVDSHGRVYYIDHANRTTTWNRPTRGTPQNETNMNDINTHWQSLDRRYQSFRRTLRGRNRHSRPPLPLSSDQNSNQSDDSTAVGSNAGSSAEPLTGSTIGSTAGPTAGPTEASRTVSEVAASTLTPKALPATRTPNSAPGPSGAVSRSRPSSAGSRSRSGSASSAARSAALMNSPAVQFITRSDFVDFIKNSGVAGQYYFQSQMLKQIISKIRTDPSQFERFRHQVELVRFLNQFADPQMELSPGWDKKVDQNGRLYFIDHNTRTTTFIDPRLPLNGTDRRSRAGTETEPRRLRAPPPRPPPPRGPSRAGSTESTGPSTPLSYNQQVIGFLTQTNIEDIIARKQPSFNRNLALKASVRRAQVEGERALERLSNNVDFVMLLSLFEDEIMSFVPAEVSQPTTQPASPVRAPTNRVPATDSIAKVSGGATSVSPSPAPYRRDFEAKVRSFHRQLYHKGYGQGPNKIKMVIRRDRLLEDAYDQIMKETARSLQRNRLEIQFAGEEGLDYGGPAREFFFLMSRQIFNPYYGLFEYSANDTYTVQVSPVSLYVDNSHEWFRFCGRIIGLVIIHQHLLDAFFTRTFYKALLRSSCDLSDVEALDALFHQSMMWVTENDIEGVLDLTFSVSEEIFGQVTERELIPGGNDIIVTEDNKKEYVAEMVKWRVERGVSEQMESIVRGFNEVIDPTLVNIFDAREMELVISGTADIDIKDWRRNTEYRSGYHDNHKVVKWFWKAVSSFDNEQRLRLLQFVTGTSSMPYEGFAALRGSTGPRKFSIERWGDFSKLPRAHTCFNRLDLPIYRTYDELLDKLTFAVEETESFAMQ